MSLYKKIKIKLFMHSIKCIVWDYDGTLYNDQNRIIGKHLKKAFFKVAKKHKGKLTLKEFEEKTKLLGSWGEAASFYSNTPTIDLLKVISNSFDKEKYIQPNPTIVSLIKSTKDKFSHLILTNSTKKEVLSGLKKIGFTKNPFKKIFSRDVTHILKPNDLLFEIIYQNYKLKKKNFLFIGDSLKTDVEPAKKFGFKSIPIWEADHFLKFN